MKNFNAKPLLKADLSSQELDDECTDDWVMEMRSIPEIDAAVRDFTDIVWYNRHDVLREKIESGKEKVDGKIWKQAKRAAARIEKRLGLANLLMDDFEWGMTNGKLSALRWVLGDEWDKLDT